MTSWGFGLVVKTLSDIRWSTGADATRSMFSHYGETVKAVTDIVVKKLYSLKQFVRKKVATSH